MSKISKAASNEHIETSIDELESLGAEIEFGKTLDTYQGLSGYTNQIRQTYKERFSKDDIGYRQLYRLIDALCEACRSYCAANKVDDEWDVEEIFNNAYDPLLSLYYTLTSGTSPTGDEYTFWHHQAAPLQQIKDKKAAQLDRDGIEQAAAEYLRQPVRVAEFDRLFLDILTALEFFGFGEEMLRDSKLLEVGGVEPGLLVRSHILWRFLKMFGTEFLFIGLLAAGALALGYYEVLGPMWSIGIAGVLLLYFTVMFLRGLIRLPAIWRAESKQKERALKLIEHMIEMYQMLASSGAISSRYFVERLKAAGEDGVVWPTSLIALAEDVEGRTKTF